MKKMMVFMGALIIAISMVAISLTTFAETPAADAPNSIEVNELGELLIKNVQDNMAVDSDTAYYPNFIYKTKLTGQYSVKASVYKLNNGGVDWLFSLGLDSPDMGGYNLNSEAMGICTNGAGILVHEQPEDRAVFITVYKVDAEGNQLEDYATGTSVKDVIGGWVDNVNMSYRFQVRADGKINLYYDLMVTENACTTVRNVIVIENEAGDNANADFSYTDGYFGMMANTNKAFTGGVAAPYDPMTLKALSYEIISNGKTDATNFANMSEKWNTITEAPVMEYAITVTGGTSSLARAAEGKTITLTAGAVPNGKEFDYWKVNTVKIEGNTFTMPAAAVVVEAIYKDKSVNKDTKKGCSGTLTATAVGAVAVLLLAAGLFVIKNKRAKKN